MREVNQRFFNWGDRVAMILRWPVHAADYTRQHFVAFMARFHRRVRVTLPLPKSGREPHCAVLSEYSFSEMEADFGSVI